ncbi:T9SS type A sorting domain-containing protein [Lutibacter sp. TH_r2]|uniref:right-handed parallel beta-helix repeat-containing protein n=1 Tax=Lutibacter sp. TH_r2 TaxID=3082083 RepID=UPI0029537ED0|nr:right-handed parallel beta-helix repeat-containing protein [Lutibacter sp. TH_r2]MDV7187991.1 T9SS type A sorting domain-containing protein [Lutibacter sp. TH_r2]
MTVRKIFIVLLFLNVVGSILNDIYAQEIHVYSTEIPWVQGSITEDIDKIYSISEAINQASSGDVIIVHEGVYREKVIVNKDNITLQNYNGEYVLVTGAEKVTGTWSDATGMTSGVKVVDISGFNIETDYSQLFANGNIQKLGRHPNRTIEDMMEVIHSDGGYAPLINGSKPSGANATGQIIFEQTTIPSVDLTGGIVRAMTGKMRNYVYGDIVSNSGNTVSFKAINNNTDWIKDDEIASTRFKFSWGYVLHKNLVDTPGEWFIENNKLYYFPSNGGNINDYRIELQAREKVLVLNNTDGIKITGINFVAGNVDFQDANNAVIDGCTFRYLHPFWTPNGYGQNDTDPKGIYLEDSSNNTFKDTYIGHSWGNMVALRSGANNSFENCTIEDFGWVGVFTSGIHINKSDNTNINNCTFGDAGRFQIRLDGDDAKVNILDSDFYGAMKMGEDAGPIEATSTGKIESLDLKGGVIAYNKIHDVTGIPVSDGSYNKQKITAFYMEDTENYTAHHNLIYNIRANNYNGDVEIVEHGEFLYLGPRYNPMDNPVNYYNNTIWNYDACISIWNIEIDNWEELGLDFDSGRMTDGHFANNIFMSDSDFKLSYVRQQLSSTGGNLGYVTLNPSPSLETTDWDAYTTHCANYNYHFNPENNVFINPTEQNSNFADVANGNFSLNSSSLAVGAGVEIPGITSSITPDCGALEGGNRVLNAGANLTLPEFLEKEFSVLNAKFSIAVTSETCPNEDNGTLTIIPNIEANYQVSFNGDNHEFTDEISFQDIKPDTYQICIKIIGETEEQCFEFKVASADELASKTNLSGKQLQVNITAGTAPFSVSVNNILVMETKSSKFNIEINQGDVIKIKTAKQCEGELFKTIDFYGEINPTPNPTTGEFRITLPITEGNIPIEIYNVQGQLISSEVYTVNSGVVQLNLNDKPVGVYFAKIKTDKPINFKIVKK